MQKNRFVEFRPKKIVILYALISVFMVFFTIVGTMLNKNGNIVWTAGTTMKICSESIGIGIILGFAVYFVIIVAHSAITFLNRKIYIDSSRVKPMFKKPVFVGGFAAIVIFLCYLPGFLAYFPGILSYDAGVQVIQIVQNDYYSHHPLVHTLMIKACLDIGTFIWGSYEAGFAVYCVLQMLVFSTAFAFGITVVFKMVSKKNLLWAYIWSAALILFCGLFEFNRYMVITVTKDGLFSIFFLLQFLFFLCLIDSNKSAKKSNWLYVCYGIALILCGLLRNNATYALFALMLIEVPVCIVNWCIHIKRSKNVNAAEKGLEKKQLLFWTKLVAVTVVAATGALMILKVVATVLGATPGDKREMLAVPIQQMARSAVYHSGKMIVPEDDQTLDSNALALLDDLFLDESYVLYEQDIADPVKRNTNTYVVRYRTKEFLNVYIGMLKSYPGDYFNAFVATENGFLNVIDESHAYINQKSVTEGMGYVQTEWDAYFEMIDVHKKSVWPKLYLKMEDWATNNKYLDYPLIKYIYMPGVYLYILLFVFVGVIRDKKSIVLPVVVYEMIYFASCLLGPTVQMRYVYPFMIMCPFMLIATYLCDSKIDTD